ncbi:kinase-like domain-containing protein, partial [Phlebopus sp. FC_14]
IYMTMYIHGDIKSQNILIGLGDHENTVFLLNFGVAKWYCDLTTGDHVPFHHTHHLIGTPAFTSINSHLGAELGCCDNLKSLIHNELQNSCNN